jgi:hypothetical protein
LIHADYSSNDALYPIEKAKRRPCRGLGWRLFEFAL